MKGCSNIAVVKWSLSLSCARSHYVQNIFSSSIIIVMSIMSKQYKINLLCINI